jgi:hypothetical protein
MMLALFDQCTNIINYWENEVTLWMILLNKQVCLFALQLVFTYFYLLY